MGISDLSMLRERSKGIFAMDSRKTAQKTGTEYEPKSKNTMEKTKQLSLRYSKRKSLEESLEFTQTLRSSDL
jgi:hypothetical protein